MTVRGLVAFILRSRQAAVFERVLSMKNILSIQSHVVFGHAGNSAAEFRCAVWASMSGR